MRHRPLIALAAAALALNGCISASLLSDRRTDAEAQRADAEADAAMKRALADRLVYCGVSGSTALGLGGIAATGTGFGANLTFNCPAKPWPTDPVVPLSQIGALTATPAAPPGPP